MPLRYLVLILIVVVRQDSRDLCCRSARFSWIKPKLRLRKYFSYQWRRPTNHDHEPPSKVCMGAAGIWIYDWARFGIERTYLKEGNKTKIGSAAIQAHACHVCDAVRSKHVTQPATVTDVNRIYLMENKFLLIRRHGVSRNVSRQRGGQTCDNEHYLSIICAHACMVYTRGGQLFLLRGHFKKAAFSWGPCLLMKVEAKSRFIASALTFTEKLEEISDLKIFLNASAGHWKRCGQIWPAGRYLPTLGLHSGVTGGLSQGGQKLAERGPLPNTRKKV